MLTICNEAITIHHAQILDACLTRIGQMPWDPASSQKAWHQPVAAYLDRLCEQNRQQKNAWDNVPALSCFAMDGEILPDLYAITVLNSFPKNKQIDPSHGWAEEAWSDAMLDFMPLRIRFSMNSLPFVPETTSPEESTKFVIAMLPLRSLAPHLLGGSGLDDFWSLGSIPVPRGAIFLPASTTDYQTALSSTAKALGIPLLELPEPSVKPCFYGRLGSHRLGFFDLLQAMEKPPVDFKITPLGRWEQNLLDRPQDRSMEYARQACNHTLACYTLPDGMEKKSVVMMSEATQYFLQSWAEDQETSVQPTEPTPHPLQTVWQIISHLRSMPCTIL